MTTLAWMVAYYGRVERLPQLATELMRIRRPVSNRVEAQAVRAKVIGTFVGMGAEPPPPDFDWDAEPA